MTGGYMNEQSDLAVLKFRVKNQAAQIAAMQKEIEFLKTEEKRKLKWGISVLGSAVLGLATIIWNMRHQIFR